MTPGGEVGPSAPRAAPASTGGSSRFATPVLILIALLGRLPFIGAGFGIDSDAWRVGLAAKYMAATGTYGSSRVPGHPVQDVIVWGLTGLGATGINGATALFSILAVYLFHRLARRLELPHPLLVSLAFAFTPLVYLHSVDALDYLWALAFMLAATELAWSDRFVLAGVSLGLATGCRITSLAMLVPLVVMCAPSKRARVLFWTGISSFLVAVICYIPVFATYGFRYLSFAHTQYPRPSYIAKELTLDVFGLLGLLGIGLALSAGLVRPWRRPARPVPESWRRFGLGLGVLVACYVPVFLRLPDDAAYLLPIVPFALLWLATTLSPRWLVFCSAMLLASSFAFKVREANLIGGAPLAAVSVRLPRGLAVELPGPIFADHARRLSEMAFGNKILRTARQLPPGSAVFVADWYPMLRYSSSQANIFQFPTRAQLDGLGRGRVFYVPETYRDIVSATGIELRAYEAVELDTRDSAAALPITGRLHDPVTPTVPNATPPR